MSDLPVTSSQHFDDIYSRFQKAQQFTPISGAASPGMAPFSATLSYGRGDQYLKALGNTARNKLLTFYKALFGATSGLSVAAPVAAVVALGFTPLVIPLGLPVAAVSLYFAKKSGDQVKSDKSLAPKIDEMHDVLTDLIEGVQEAQQGFVKNPSRENAEVLDKALKTVELIVKDGKLRKDGFIPGEGFDQEKLFSLSEIPETELDTSILHALDKAYKAATSSLKNPATSPVSKLDRSTFGRETGKEIENLFLGDPSPGIDFER